MTNLQNNQSVKCHSCKVNEPTFNGKICHGCHFLKSIGTIK